MQQNQSDFSNYYNFEDIIAFHNLQVSQQSKSNSNDVYQLEKNPLPEKVQNKVTQVGNSLIIQLSVQVGNEILHFTNSFELHCKQSKPIESFMYPISLSKKLEVQEKKEIEKQQLLSNPRQSSRKVVSKFLRDSPVKKSSYIGNNVSSSSCHNFPQYPSNDSFKKNEQFKQQKKYQKKMLQQQFNSQQQLQLNEEEEEDLKQNYDQKKEQQQQVKQDEIDEDAEEIKKYIEQAKQSLQQFSPILSSDNIDNNCDENDEDDSVVNDEDDDDDSILSENNNNNIKQAIKQQQQTNNNDDIIINNNSVKISIQRDEDSTFSQEQEKQQQQFNNNKNNKNNQYCLQKSDKTIELIRQDYGKNANLLCSSSNSLLLQQLHISGDNDDSNITSQNGQSMSQNNNNNVIKLSNNYNNIDQIDDLSSQQQIQQQIEYSNKKARKQRQSKKEKKVKVKSSEPSYQNLYQEDELDEEFQNSLSFKVTPTKILNIEELKQFGIFTNRKNAVKNIVKAFIRYLSISTYEKEILADPNIESQKILNDIIKCVIRLERKRKYNQQLIYNIFNQDKLNYAFRLFLRNYATKWLRDSKISDQHIYEQVLSDYLKLFNTLK